MDDRPALPPNAPAAGKRYLRLLAELLELLLEPDGERAVLELEELLLEPDGERAVLELEELL